METATRTLFITGITSGIGQEVLRLALADGFRAVGVVRSEAQKQALLAAYPERLALHVADLRQRDSVYVVAEQVNGTAFSHILLNAGYAELGKLHEITHESMADMLEANLIGHTLLLKSLLPQCIPNRTRLCLVSSLAARMPGRNYATYGMAKAGLSYLAEALALEYPALRILCVEIGGVATPFHQKCDSGFSVKQFKTQEETGKRLYKALLRRQGFTTLYWDWALARWLFLHFRAPIIAARRRFHV
ncbi:MAG: SDR family oxidoreductase [Pseudomonadota bacterium]|nr:SDR family oxidoreductase [Pseudomonadota bacterium]